MTASPERSTGVDDLRFDTWVRTLARGRSRRAVVGGLLGSGAAIVAARFGLDTVRARRYTASWGDPCWDSDQCYAADAPLVCAWNGCGHDGDYNCCTYDGSRCGDDCDCCGYSTCVGGWCTASSDGGYSNGSASAGNGGVANASADGGVVSIGDIDSGGNVGNVVDVGNTYGGGVRVYGGNVSNSTDVSVSADGGTAISDASG